jgi:hypothetical protein
MEPIVTGTDRSTTPSTLPKSYLSGTLNRELSGGAGGGAATSATSVVTLAATLDFPAQPTHAASAASAQNAGDCRREAECLSRGLMRESSGLTVGSVSAPCHWDSYS